MKKIIIRMMLLLAMLAGANTVLAVDYYYDTDYAAAFACDTEAFASQEPPWPYGCIPYFYDANGTEIFFGDAVRHVYIAWWEYSQVFGPNYTWTSKDRHIYIVPSEIEYGSYSEALQACRTFWAGNTTVEYNCGTGGNDSLSPFVVHAYSGVSASMTCVHKYRYDVNRNPTVSITTPNNGAVFYKNNPVTISGSASDPEQGNLSASIQWSIPGGSPATSSGASFTTYFSSIGRYTITANVTDSGGLKASPVSRIIIITDSPNKTPTVSITAPNNGATFYKNDPVTISGSASDPEQGNLSASIRWSIPGGSPATGSGSSFTTSFSSIGTYTITANVTDSGGLSASPVSRNITITDPPNKTPTVSITAPANGATFYKNDPVTISGSASDPEDGGLSGSIQWSIDGVVANSGPTFTSSFSSIGTYTITANVTDSGGLPAPPVSRSINIISPVVIISPVQVVKGSPPESYKPVTLSVSSATINGVDAKSNVTWSSNIDGSLGSGLGGSITRRLSPGTHTITASLTSDNITANSQITFDIIKDVVSINKVLPAGGRTFDIDEVVSFDASVIYQGKVSSDATYSWVSNLDGPLASISSFNTTTLTEGQHEITITATMPSGEVGSKKIFLTIFDSDKNLGGKEDDKCMGGNPINLLTGNKYLEETDYSTATETPLYIKRSYNSSSDTIGLFGYGWNSNLDERIDYNVTAQQASVVSEAGAVQRFDYDTATNSWIDASSSKGTLERLPDNSWKYTLYDKTIKTYNAQGKILTIDRVSGLSITYNYVSGVLDSISDEYGYSISFKHNAQGYIEQVTEPDTYAYSYLYNNDNLTFVIYPDETPGNGADNPRKQYLYENVVYPHALTGLIDEENIRFATWDYDDYGRAYFSTHANGAENFSIAWNADGTVTTTNALGKQTNYTYASVKGILKVKEVTGYKTNNCAANWTGTTYDPVNGFANVKTDWRGNQILLQHNDFGQVTSTTVVDKGTGWAVAPTDIRTTTTTQYNNLQLPWITEKPGLRIEKLYDKGRISQLTATDTTTHTLPYSTSGTLRRTNYSYFNFSGSDVVRTLVIDGPRSDVVDNTAYIYDRNGNLVQTYNAFRRSIGYLEHNSFGSPGKMIDENGLVTTYQYTPRGWLKSETVDLGTEQAITRYTYYNNGLLKTRTDANGKILTYYYNDARQLDYVVNNLGEKQDYEPNILNGAWEKITYQDVNGTIQYQKNRSLDDLGRPYTFSTPEGHYTSLARDPDGNVTQSTQTIGFGNEQITRNTKNYYDALNRLRRIESDDRAITHYTYDTAGNLTQVKVAGTSDQITAYVYNGFGNVISEKSPATGETIFYFDEAGNQIQIIDSESKSITKAYDVLNRITFINYSGASEEDVTYIYDQTSNGVGRLSSVTDQSGTQRITYSSQGYPDVLNYSIGSSSYLIDYDFDKAGQLRSITYPGGRKVDYQYDVLGRIKKVDTSGGAQGAKTLLGSIQYKPFGPIESITYGNGWQRTVNYDTVYRPDSITYAGPVGTEVIDYQYDTADRLRALTKSSAGTVTDQKSFEYDLADRLKATRWGMRNGVSLASQNESIEYDYDLVGNRTYRRVRTQNGAGGAINEAWYYAINGSNNQLDAISYSSDGGPVYYQTNAYAYNNTGTTRTNGTLSMAYNASNRLKGVSLGNQTLGTYLFNASGQRTKKTANGKTTHFHYDLLGNLISETTEKGELIREYMYLGNLPIAMVTSTSVYDDVESTPQTLIGQNNLKLDAKNQEQTALQAITGDNLISGNISNQSNIEGREYVGLTMREQADGLSGAKIDVVLTAVNTSTMNMIFVKTPDGKMVPIPIFDDSTGPEILKISTTSGYGRIQNETFTPKGDYIALERIGQYVVVSVSINGQNWDPLKIINLPMLDDAYMGAIAQNAKVNLTTNYATANDNLFYLHTDHLGSVYSVSSNSSKGKVWQRNDFEVGTSAFGVDTLANNSAQYNGLFEMPLRFPGQYYDSESGLHYNYFRTYDPGTGRYATSDPIGLEGGINTYLYANANPQIYIDPDGLIGLFGHSTLLNSFKKDGHRLNNKDAIAISQLSNRLALTGSLAGTAGPIILVGSGKLLTEGAKLCGKAISNNKDAIKKGFCAAGFAAACTQGRLNELDDIGKNLRSLSQIRRTNEIQKQTTQLLK